VRPDYVIHCASEGSVDYCEANKDKSHAVNVGGTINVAKSCREHGSLLVFLSMNAVFGGDLAPYTETNDRCPINEYGMQKTYCEDAVRMHPRHLVLRPIMLYGRPYGFGRSNWYSRVKCSAGSTLYGVNDVLTQPTYVGDLTRIIWNMLKHETTGTYHIGGPCTMTIYDYMKSMALLMDVRVNVVPVSSNYFKSLAPRPKDTTYDLGFLEEYAYLAGIEMPVELSKGIERIERHG